MSRAMWKAVVLGGVVLFLWGNVSWVVLPWHDMTFSAFADEDEVARVLSANTAGRGVYLYPGQHHEAGMTAEERAAAEAAMMEKAKAGPFLFVALDDGGMASMTWPMLVGFVIQLLAALVLALIVRRCGDDFWERVSVVVLVVLAAGILCYLPLWNWFGFATGFTVVMVLDLLAAGLLAGPVIARFAP